MDACTYESITGLKNYYGLKSLLKNSSFSNRFGCDDDTIVFNRVVTMALTNSFSVGPNQFYVLLELSSWNSSSTTGVELVKAKNLNGETCYLVNNALVKGFVGSGTLSYTYNSGLTGPKQLTIAIFDLY